MRRDAEHTTRKRNLHTLSPSLRSPKEFLGDAETWDAAEQALQEALTTFLALKSAGSMPEWYSGSAYEPAQLASVLPATFEVDEGGGAFYGPKIDVAALDALGREHQCGTVQLDFQLPRRFGLKYRTGEGEDATPVIIHRALLGSVERMMAILTEHYGGRWPFWLSPRQVAVLPVADRHTDAAHALARSLKARGISVEVDASTRSVPKKVRAAQVSQFNVMAVLGDAEVQDGTLALRFRDQDTASAAGAQPGKPMTVRQGELEGVLAALAAAS